MCSKVLNGHIILTDTSITTILAPEMTYTPNFLAGKIIPEVRIREYLRAAGWEQTQEEQWAEKDGK